MEAFDFLKEAQRMCRSTECHLNCPVSDVCFLQNYDVVSEDDMKTFVSSVEVWCKRNPPKTNAQKFKEVFGAGRFYDLVNTDLSECARDPDWWNAPYKEPEHEL